MAIANANYEFIMVDIGTNSRVWNVGIIKNTTLWNYLVPTWKKKMQLAEPVIEGEALLNYVFVGDEALASRTDFLKPYI